VVRVIRLIIDATAKNIFKVAEARCQISVKTKSYKSKFYFDFDGSDFLQLHHYCAYDQFVGDDTLPRA
jgi:hypothetical protein